MSYTRTELIERIEKGQTVRLYGSIFNAPYYDKLSVILGLILEKYNKTDITQIVLAVTQEMATHASVDNCFAVYLQSQGVDWSSPVEWDSHEKDFEAHMNLQNLPEYRRVAKNIGLILNIEISHNNDGIKVEVKNNSNVSEDREQKLRFYLKQAMNYTNIMEYYQDHPDDEDGRKIGLALSLLMLKDIKARPELLRLGKTEGERISRLELPFEESYKSIRDRILNDEEILPFENTDIYRGSSAMKILVKTRCPVCFKEMDDRLFFAIPPMDLLSHDSLLADHPDWNPEHGICAECIAFYGV